MSIKNTSLEKLRKEIDQLDLKLIDIIRKRFKVTEKVGILKTKNNLPLEDLKREKTLSSKKEKLAKKAGLKSDLIIKIFKLLIKEVKENHKRIKKGWPKR